MSLLLNVAPNTVFEVAGVPLKVRVVAALLVAFWSILVTSITPALAVIVRVGVVCTIDLEKPATVETFPELVTSPVRLALVVTLPAVKLAAEPEMLVPTNTVGVPRSPLRIASVPLASGNSNARFAVMFPPYSVNEKPESSLKNSIPPATELAIPNLIEAAFENVWLLAQVFTAFVDPILLADLNVAGTTGATIAPVVL